MNRFASQVAGAAAVSALLLLNGGCPGQQRGTSSPGQTAPAPNAPATVPAIATLPAQSLDPKAVEQMTDYEKKIVAHGGRPLLHLDLSGTKITDDDLAALEILPMVTSMDLSYTNVTDRGIEHLKKYPQLERLTIVGVPITDASIEHFKEMKRLWKVDLDGTNVTQAGGLQLIRLLGPRANEHMYKPKPGRPMRN